MKKRYSIPIVLVLLVLGGATAFALLEQFYQTPQGFELKDWQFYTSDKWNSGKIKYLGAGLDGLTLKGDIHFQAVGWEGDHRNTFSLDPNRATIIPPKWKLVTRNCWRLSGTIVSTNAGTITLTGSMNDNGTFNQNVEKTDAYFNPVTRQLEGYAHSNTLGRVWLGDDMYCFLNKKTKKELEAFPGNNSKKNPYNKNYHTEKNSPEIQKVLNKIREFDAGKKMPWEAWEITEDILTLIQSRDLSGFIGKVKIIGATVSGDDTISDRIFGVQTSEEYTKFHRVISDIRGNAFTKMRNLPTEFKNSDKTETKTAKKHRDLLIFNTPKSIVDINEIPNDVRTVIIFGADAVISQDIPKNYKQKPIAIIALKENGNWGNVFIQSDVKNIYASIIAEWSLFSGDGVDKLKENKFKHYNDSAEKLAEMSSKYNNQLYIFGLLMSRNTIGGATKDSDFKGAKCPYNINCKDNSDEPLRYDLNSFRVFDKNQNNTASDKNGNEFKDYSFIIEYNPELRRNPPPLFEVTR